MMNRICTLTMGGLLLLSASAFGQAQPPATPPATQAPAAQPAATVPSGNPTRVAIVNIQKAIGECAEGKKAADELTKRFTPKRNELEALSSQIQAKQKQMQDGEKVMSDDQKATLAREIDRLTKTFNNQNQEANDDYQQAMDSVINGIGAKMLQVISVYAQRNGYDLVLNSANPGEVLFALNRVDITEEVIGAFNMTNFNTPAPPAQSKPATPKPDKPATPPPATKKP